MKKLILSLVTAGLFSLGAVAQTSESAYMAKAPERVGNMRSTKFQMVNDEGARKVRAIEPSSTALSITDQSLLNQIAMGGMRQLAISQAVLAKATDPEVRMLAQSEVEEQTLLSSKLKEIAAAKGATLPTSPDAETMALVEKIQSSSAEEVNRMYLAEGGVKGHVLLKSTMKTVKDDTDDDTLKMLAKATLPVIKTHLKVAEKSLDKMDDNK